MRKAGLKACASQRRGPHSALDFDATPEGDVVADVLSCGLRVRIIPGRVAVLFAIDHNVVVARLALPGAERRGIAGREVFALQRLGRKIDVIFHRLVAVGFGDDFLVPDSAWHGYRMYLDKS